MLFPKGEKVFRVIQPWIWINKYKAYLTNKKTINHNRKKTTVWQINSEIGNRKILSGSQSVSKITKGILKKENPSDSVKKSMNGVESDSKYLTKPQNRKLFEKNTYITKSEISKQINTPTSISQDIKTFKTSGALTARMVDKESVGPELQKSEK